MDVECPTASRTVGDQQRVALCTTFSGAQGTFGFDVTSPAASGDGTDRPGRPPADDRLPPA